MRIDRSHWPWFVGASLALEALALAYWAYSAQTPGGPRGGTGFGLAFGVLGYALMLFEGALGLRKKVPVWRIGRAQTWMRAHIWLGTLALPLILFHGGFAFRGTLTAALMMLLFVVTASGIFGAAVQHYLPRIMAVQVPLETIYEEIPHVRQQLRDEAEQMVLASGVEVDPEDKARLREAYAESIAPFLNDPGGPAHELADERRSQAFYGGLRRTTPAALHTAIQSLEDICEEQRQLTRQRRLYHFLHGWLLVHVPLSIALIVLGGVHAVVALRY